jgi:hypothetical protein
MSSYGKPYIYFRLRRVPTKEENAEIEVISSITLVVLHVPDPIT